MRLFFLLSFFLLSFSFFSKGIGEFAPMYTVVNDTIDPTVPRGKCLITGRITRNNQIVSKGIVFTTSGVKATSDNEGMFKILVDTSDTYLVIHKSPFRDAFVEGYKFEHKHRIQILIYMPEDYEMEMQEKPVIYAYSDKNLDAQISIKPKGEFTFTYPTLNEENNWNISINENQLYCDGKDYPYLFWEAKTENILYAKNEKGLEGQIVKADMALSFLEKELTNLGLNDTEKTDFITYWGPRLTQSNYAFIQLKVDEAYNDIATIEITPNPTNMRRVYLLFTPFETFPSHLEIQLVSKMYAPLPRDGFTIIEWGGSEISINQLNKQL